MTQPLQPSQEHQQQMLKRLARIEGQVRGIQRLINDEQDCEKILQQFTAARKAMDKAFIEMIACLLEACLANPTENQEQITQIRQLLSRYA